MFGLAAVYWAGLSPQFSGPYFLLKAKTVFVLAGIGLALVLSRIDYHIYEKRGFQIGISLAVIVMLILLFFVGLKEHGANLRLPLFSRTIQPTEYAKIIVVIVFSYTITDTYRRDLLSYFVLSVQSFFLWGLVVLIAMQPDYGAVLILIVASLGMLIVARLQARRSLFIVAFSVVLGGLVFLLGCLILKDDFYVLNRFRIYMECFLVAGCREYQISNAYNVIASGGFFGNGIAEAIHPHGVLPMESNDFIFCVIAEELGFLGITVLLSVFVMFIRRGFSISKHCRDFFGQLMAFGLTWTIGFQVLLNILVATGLSPITGVTLPFISQGGNSLLSVMIATGILLNISKNTV